MTLAQLSVILILSTNWRVFTINKRQRINEAITAPVLMLIDETGEKVGEISLSDALRLAEERGLDLVEVAPQLKPPVCKLINYDKLRYEEARAIRKARAKQKNIDVKEIRMGMKISEHDANLKVDQAKKFLEHGDKVRLVMKMRGREQIFASRAFELITQIAANIGGTVEQSPSKLGNQVSVTIRP